MTAQTRSFTTNGTPLKGPSAGSVASACSNSGWMTAFRSPLRASIRSIAPSASSRAVTSPERTSAACAVASRCGSIARERNWPRGQGLSSESRPGFGTFHPMEPTSTASRQGKSGSLENPEVLRERPGPRDPDPRARVRRLRQRGASKFLDGETAGGPVHRLPPQAGRLRPAPGRRPDDPREAAVRRRHAGADGGVRRRRREVRAAEQGPHHHAPELPVPPHPAAPTPPRRSARSRDVRPLQPRGLRQHRPQRDRRPVGGRLRGRAVRPHPLRRAPSCATSCATRRRQLLPRKFKIAFTATDEDRAITDIHDLGFVPRDRSDGR